MKKTQLLSLKEAVLININIMLGVGIFINTVLLAQHTYLLSGTLYIINGLLVLPLILSMAALMKIHPRGGFYTFGAQEIHPFAGFLSAWSYFIGKLASGTLMIHTAFLLLQSIIPTIASINILLLDFCALFLFTALNLLHMKVGMLVQGTPFILKLIPIAFVIGVGSTFGWSETMTLPSDLFSVLTSMPLVLFTALGFEATLSLSSHIDNPEENGPKAIIIAFSLVSVACFLFQTCCYLLLGQELSSFASYLSVFPALLQKVCGNQLYTLHFARFFHIAIACSALGGAYSILFSTHWNLYNIAANHYSFFSDTITKKNRYGMPTICILLQAVLCALYFVCTHGNQLPLQLTASFGCIIAYAIAVCALLYAQKRNVINTSHWIGWLAIVNCILLMLSSCYSLFSATVYSFLMFISLFISGIGMFWIQSTKKQ